MATREGRYPRVAGVEAAAEPRGRPAVQEDLRRLLSLLEARQRRLRTRIAACEELTAEMAALRAALAADCRPHPVSSGPGSEKDQRGEAGDETPRPPALPRSGARREPGGAGDRSVPGGGEP